MACPICDSASAAPWRSGLYDDRYGYPGRFELLKCKACGHAFLDALFNPEQLGDLYSRFYPRKSMDVTSYAPKQLLGGWRGWWIGERSAAFAWVPPNSRVLDVGCGFGHSLGFHQARGCEAYGIEADENAQRVAQAHGLRITHGLFDGSGYATEFFDVITFDQVAEHLVDPVATIRATRKLLKADGKLILSFPNAQGWGAWLFGRHWINWHTPYHLHFFSRRSIGVLAEKAGLYVELERTLTHSDWLRYQWMHLVNFPSEGNSSVFWKPQPGATSGRSIWWERGIRALHKIGLNAMLTRLFDAIGKGDNRIVVMRRR
ncbi:MAG: class I SAM-dependent methyltransferase [Zoogloeaceae bacterium]|nr:class I SAM-dependent methyltransferase [Zoogloeaceae bacterium]